MWPARYRARHLKPKPKKHGPVVVGTAAAVVLSQGTAYAGSYKVQPGDTLSAIARSHGTTVTALARRNHLSNPNLIYAGSTLSIGSGNGSGSPSVPAAARTHVVLTGETLSNIAARYGTSIESIVRANDIADPNLIVIGQHLDIPAGGAHDVEYLLETEAAAHSLDPSLVKAVAWQESGWNQKARSSAGAIGIMQVMPGTARYINESLGGGSLRVRKAHDNIRLGTTYLRHVMTLTGSEQKGLAAYYSGPGNVGARLKGYQKPYVRAVRALKARFR